MNRIWKWNLHITDEQDLSMPKDAQILSVKHQFPEHPSIIQLWALCNPDEEKEIRHFRIYGTGHPIEEYPGIYLGTVMVMNGLQVYHVFEVKKMSF